MRPFNPISFDRTATRGRPSVTRAAGDGEGVRRCGCRARGKEGGMRPLLRSSWQREIDRTLSSVEPGGCPREASGESGCAFFMVAPRWMTPKALPGAQRRRRRNDCPAGQSVPTPHPARQFPCGRRVVVTDRRRRMAVGVRVHDGRSPLDDTKGATWSAATASSQRLPCREERPNAVSCAPIPVWPTASCF